jgi:hypothetical protein
MRQIRFSLRTFLIVAPVAGALIAWGASLLMRTAITAEIEVMRKPFAYYDAPPDPNIDLVDATPDDVILAAVQSLSQKSRAWIDADDDAVGWIRRKVRITIVRGTILQIAIVNDAPVPGETAVEKDVVNALALAFSEAQPSAFHKIFFLNPHGIRVRHWAWVDRYWF